MSHPRSALPRIAALLLALLGATACGAPQRDLAAISGVPDAPFGGGRGNQVTQWGSMTTGGQSVVMHRELPQ